MIVSKKKITVVLFLGLICNAFHASCEEDHHDVALMKANRPRQTIESRLHMLFFDTSTLQEHQLLAVHQAKKAGIPYSLIGTGTEYTGFGQKWRFVRGELEQLLELQKIAKDSLMVVSDVRDTLLNSASSSSDGGVTNAELVVGTSSLADDLSHQAKVAFEAITEGQDEDAVVFGTEFSCCVFAMTHATPNDYFDSTGTKRIKRSCHSGKEGCEWKGSAKAMPWVHFQLDLAKERTGGVVYDVADAYLNGGLMIGKASSILKLIELVDLEDTEDDQAVFTGMMYRRPDLVLLDYGNEIFGTARFSLGMANGGCCFEKKPNGSNRLQHKELKSTPLMLHTPNHFYECYDTMSSLLEEERSVAMKELAKDSRALELFEGESFAFKTESGDNHRFLAGSHYGTAGTASFSGSIAAVGATVTLTNDSTSAVVTETVDGSNNFSFTGLAAGTYSIAFSGLGDRPFCGASGTIPTGGSISSNCQGSVTLVDGQTFSGFNVLFSLAP